MTLNYGMNVVDKIDRATDGFDAFGYKSKEFDSYVSINKENYKHFAGFLDEIKNQPDSVGKSFSLMDFKNYIDRQIDRQIDPQDDDQAKHTSTERVLAFGQSMKEMGIDKNLFSGEISEDMETEDWSEITATFTDSLPRAVSQIQQGFESNEFFDINREGAKKRKRNTIEYVDDNARKHMYLSDNFIRTNPYTAFKMAMEVAFEKVSQASIESRGIKAKLSNSDGSVKVMDAASPQSIKDYIGGKNGATFKSTFGHENATLEGQVYSAEYRRQIYNRKIYNDSIDRIQAGNSKLVEAIKLFDKNKKEGRGELPSDIILFENNKAKASKLIEEGMKEVVGGSVAMDQLIRNDPEFIKKNCHTDNQLMFSETADGEVTKGDHIQLIETAMDRAREVMDREELRELLPKETAEEMDEKLEKMKKMIESVVKSVQSLLQTITRIISLKTSDGANYQNTVSYT